MTQVCDGSQLSPLGSGSLGAGYADRSRGRMRAVVEADPRSWTQPVAVVSLASTGTDWNAAGSTRVGWRQMTVS